MSDAAPTPAWGPPAWHVERIALDDEPVRCAGCCTDALELLECPGCARRVCTAACARRMHGGRVSCAWYDRPAYPGEPASYDGTPWPCDACGGELPPAAYDPVAVADDGMTWHACGPVCRARVARRLVDEGR